VHEPLDGLSGLPNGDAGGVLRLAAREPWPRPARCPSRHRLQSKDTKPRPRDGASTPTNSGTRTAAGTSRTGGNSPAARFPVTSGARAPSTRPSATRWSAWAIRSRTTTSTRFVTNTPPATGPPEGTSEHYRGSWATRDRPWPPSTAGPRIASSERTRPESSLPGRPTIPGPDREFQPRNLFQTYRRSL